MTGLSRRFAVGMMCAVVLHGSVGSPARASDSSTDITTGMQALVDDAINHASPFIVRIETVGGVQPLDQLLHVVVGGRHRRERHQIGLEIDHLAGVLLQRL